MSESTQNLNICDGDYVVLRREKVFKSFQVGRNRTVWMEKSKIKLDGLIGQPWGSKFEVQRDGKLVKAKHVQEDDAETGELKDNRNLLDVRVNQKLTRDEIMSMKKEGATGHDIVENLIENSSTFNQKSEFAQQKYIKRKKKKHLAIFTTLKPTTRVLAQMYYNRGPSKILNMRIDTLGRILNQANVHAGCKVMVVENCVGLLVGAVMERMGGQGDLVHFYNGTAPVRPAVENYNFPSDYENHIQSFPLKFLDSIVASDSNNSSEESKCDITTDKSQCLDPDEVDMVESKCDATASCVSHDSDAAKGSSPTDGSTNDTASNGDLEKEKSETEDLKTDEIIDKNAEECKEATDDGATKDEASSETNTNKRPCPESGNRHGNPFTEIQLARRQRQEETKTFMKKRHMDALIVATKFHPTPVVLELMKYLMPSRPIVVYCQYKEPLIDCYFKLKDCKNVLSLELTETWLREYQILPNRTHPAINMSGGGGYLLTGTTVNRENVPEKKPQ